MLFRGVFELSSAAESRRITVDLFSEDIPSWRVASAEISPWSRGRYFLSTGAQYYAAAKTAQGTLLPVSRKRLLGLAIASLMRGPDFLTKLKLVIKGLLHANHTDWEDAIGIATQVSWSENNAVLRGNHLVFEDGLTLPATNDVIRLRPFASRSMALFAHYEPFDGVSAEDQHSWDCLTRAGFDVVVISTSLSRNTALSLGSICAVITRPNAGHDFFSWRVAMETFPEWEDAERLVLANNSAEISSETDVRRAAAAEADFVCVTDSVQSQYHADSYFLAFRLSEEVRTTLRRFFSGVGVLASKSRIISEYEIGLTRSMSDIGCQPSALYPYRDLVERLKASRERHPGLYRRWQGDPRLNGSKDFRALLIEQNASILKKLSKVSP